MGKEIRISAIVLFDETTDKKLLEKCLASIKWVDEIIQVNTTKIKGSFSEWRNYGLKKATGKWIFYLDTDEEVPQALKEEMLNILDKESMVHFAYAIPRKNFIFGKEFKYSGQWPDYQKRLFLKEKFKGWRGELHEEPIFDGTLGHLKNPLIHHKDITISQMLEKTNKWSEIEADLMLKANHPPMNNLRFFSAGIREFFLRMFVQKAFLDGKEGIIYAIYQVYSKLISYSKLWEKQQNK